MVGKCFKKLFPLFFRQDGLEVGHTLMNVHSQVLPRKAGYFHRNDSICDELHKREKEEHSPTLWSRQEGMAAGATASWVSFQRCGPEGTGNESQGIRTGASVYGIPHYCK